MKTRGGGKHKGSAFERAIARHLSEWLTHGHDPKVLIRSVLSGGWRPTERAQTGGWRHAGDLAPNGYAGEQFRKVFAVECKHYRSINLWALWQGRYSKDPLWKWWAKITEEAVEAKVSPMLIFKANNTPILVMLPRGILDFHTPDAVHVPGHQVSIMTLKALFEYQPETFVPGLPRKEE